MDPDGHFSGRDVRPEKNRYEPLVTRPTDGHSKSPDPPSGADACLVSPGDGRAAPEGTIARRAPMT